jgi:hypothetical protein
LSASNIYTASAYANILLASLGESKRCTSANVEPHPALRYAQSGLLALTGNKSESQICPLPLATCADGVIAALNLLAGNGLDIDGAALLGERAALMGLTRAGSVSAGGSCRLLPTNDGWLAVNLARAYDWEMLPAWLEIDATQSWGDVAAALTRRTLGDCIERGRLLGLAVAAVQPSDFFDQNNAPHSWFNLAHQSVQQRSKNNNNAPLVIDLSSLWAGPLCSHLLQQLGARVIKVESSARPDGARSGSIDFYNLLNAGKASVAIDFSTAGGRAQLRELCARADIVIEASRPRALRQLGIDAEAMVAANSRLTWLSITGYGRAEPEANWVAFGDDAGVAAGLSAIFQQLGSEPLFCGDAIADPLTGLHAALAAWQSYKSGGGRLIALALRDVIAHCLQFSAPHTPAVLRERQSEWQTVIEQAQLSAMQPSARQPQLIAAALGADTEMVLAELGIPC